MSVSQTFFPDLTPHASPVMYAIKPDGWFTTAEWVTAQAVEVVPPTLEDLKAKAIDSVKEKSWLVETGGITLQGMAIPTDRESQSMITGAVVGTLLNPSQVTRWQTAGTNADGTPVFINLDADTIKYIGMAVRQHVQACFDLRDVKCVAVAKLKTVEAVNDWLETELMTGWPA